MKNIPTPYLPAVLVLAWFCIFCPVATSLAADNSQCLECHGDEGLTRSGAEDINQSYIRVQLFVDADRFNRSVHHANEIACVDCHADIGELDFSSEVPHRQRLAPVNCTACHEEQARAFLGSSHMQARRKGIVMNCYACHDYHYVRHMESASVAERGNTFCLRCHNPFQSHGWLSQKAAHFALVECSVCHAPQARRHINLSFYDLVSNKSLSGDDLLDILGLREEEFMPRVDRNRDGVISSGEFDDLVLMLRQKTVHTIVHAELIVELEPAVHSISKDRAVRECTLCHAPDSPFFNAVTIALSKSNGRVDHFEVDRAVLESYHTSHFSALAGTRIRLLDKIGFLMLAGAASVVSLHLLTRLSTTRMRRKKEED